MISSVHLFLCFVFNNKTRSCTFAFFFDFLKVGIDPSLITGARYVLNIKIPPLPANVAPNKTDDDWSYEESDEKWQYIDVQLSGQ